MNFKMRKLLALVCFVLLLPQVTLAKRKFVSPDFVAQIADLERKEGGRIGVAALNTEDGQRLEYRDDERFAMCSTFKFLLVAAVLARVDADQEELDRYIRYSSLDMLDYAPITKNNFRKRRMTVGDLSAAAIEHSDNTAANLLLNSIEGPKGLTNYMRSLGDTVTRLDRNEPTLNSNIDGDVRDTTTPFAMVESMYKLLIGDALSPKSRELITNMLLGNATGKHKLRAGINPEWKVGDKTGSGENGASNDVAIVFPTDKKPFLVAVFYTGSNNSTDKKNEIIAEIGRIVSTSFYPNKTKK
jgi:beta-lactamase class A